MVDVITCGYSEFLSRTINKKKFCFGAGKRFSEFLLYFPDIYIDGVIDNFCSINHKIYRTESGAIPIMTLNEYIAKYSTDSVIIITCRVYEEIIEQLDSVDLLSNKECYLDICLQECSDDVKLQGIKDIVINRSQKYKTKNEFCVLNKRSTIRRFQIWECIDVTNTAGSKAPDDVRNILGRMGFQEIDIHQLRGAERTPIREWSIIQNNQDWDRCYDLITDNSILFLQHPFRQEQKKRNLTLKKLKAEKNVKIISLVHDIEKQRKGVKNDYIQQEADFMMHIADILIVHNQVMKEYFVSLGFEEKYIICLGVFDYLTSQEVINRKQDKSIAIAGNLDPVKSPFVEKLQSLVGVKIHLFGPNYMHTFENSNLVYHGVYSADELPSYLLGSFGLVWDGDSIETCAGATGNYLRYNNPHKLSLYLAAGLPIVIWREAAEAKFVIENGVGVTINSLYDLAGVLEKVTMIQYEEMCRSVARISFKLRQGEYTKSTIRKAVEKLRAR